MADTVRTQAAILALFADNITGDISAQDMRDYLVSVEPGSLAAYISTPVETTINTVNVWEEVAGTTTVSGTPRHWTQTANNEWTYDNGAIPLPDRDCVVYATISSTAAANSKVYEWAVSVNDTIQTPSIVRRKQGTGADVGALAIMSEFQVSSGDVVSIEVRNITDNTNVTAELMNVEIRDTLQ